MRISDWSSDVCSSDLTKVPHPFRRRRERGLVHLHRGAIEQLHARNDRVPVHIETSHPITDPSHRIYPLQAQRPPEGNQERIRICGSCSKRHSPVTRVPLQTDNGLEAPRNKNRKSRVEGKSGSVRVDIRGRRINKKQKIERKKE